MDEIMTDRVSIWNEYLGYLHEWINVHQDAKNYEMSPACFHEWLDNEAHEPEEVEG